MVKLVTLYDTWKITASSDPYSPTSEIFALSNNLNHENLWQELFISPSNV